ncbi:MAG: hypothetical protein HN929_12485 [Chloroflexi bacterium]|nr:hypothetical protein [Chloroflexota bacterium]MBT7082258.1 hypothetical protein [Chloroflexota bacterium]MBT7289549.1 hypothetical protein [Chloroflexota bacterium]
MKKIKITTSNVSVHAELNDTNTAESIWQALPISGSAHLWGQEIYFIIPLKLDSEDGKETVQLGDLGYWPEGKAFCIFFGQTPISGPDEIRPASAVNVFGKLTGDPKAFLEVLEGDSITIQRD